MGVDGVAAVPGLAHVLAEDADHPAAELVDLAAYCHGVIAVAEYRMARLASLIHEEFVLEHQAKQAARECATADEVVGRAALAQAGEKPADAYGPTGLEAAVAEIGAALTVTPSRARELIRAGDAMRYRLPFTASWLCCARIDLRRFFIAVNRTDLCDGEALDLIDRELSIEISERPPMSIGRFTALVDALVARFDPEAIRERRRRAGDDRKVGISPDRFRPGQSRLSGSMPIDRAAEVAHALERIAKSVHAADPRTAEQLRADALLALARGHGRLFCLCAYCENVRAAEQAPLESDGEGDTGPTDDATASGFDDTDEPDVDGVGTEEPDPGKPCTDMPNSDTPGTESDDGVIEGPPGDPVPITVPGTCTGDCACSGQPLPEAFGEPRTRVRPWFHIVVNLSTLLGLDELPAHVDGQGVIDAQTARELLREAERSFVREPGPSAGYVPSPKLAEQVRAEELSCTFPGCDAAVWGCDLDHVEPYDHDEPAAGGQTCRHNLRPLCRFHHRIKTHLHWTDFSYGVDQAIVVSPTGKCFWGKGFGMPDLFAAADAILPPDPDNPAHQEIERARRRRRIANRSRLRRNAIDDPPPF